jgi:putative holliday junction resolvase
VSTSDNHAPDAPPSRDLAAFLIACPTGALLGVDPGEKRIGLAVSDPTRLIASPLETITRQRFTNDAATLWGAFDHRRCAGLVIGLPLDMDGREGPAAQSARAFARNLTKLRPVPILLWDERLTTAAVTRAMIDADMTRAKRAKEVDKLAAAYMLQGALDAMQERKV